MKHPLTLVVALASAAGFFAAGHADASFADCGNIHVDASASCELDVTGGCKAKCSPVNFEAQCAAQLETSCTGKCDASAKAECTASCDTRSCMARCEVDPAKFDCRGECYAQGKADCDARCATGDGHGECVASCQAEFSAKCDANCELTPGSVDCMASCEGSCQGSCEAKASVACQIECQSPQGYASCQAKLQGGCEAACTKPEGALFCDGQYVDYGDHLAKCRAALDAYLKAHVTVSSSSSGECSNGECHGEAKASANATCAMSPAFAGSGMGGIALTGLCLAALVRRRRRAGV